MSRWARWRVTEKMKTIWTMKNSARWFGPSAWFERQMFYYLAGFPLHVTLYSLHFLVLSNINSVRPHIPFSHSWTKDRLYRYWESSLPVLRNEWKMLGSLQFLYMNLLLVPIDCKLEMFKIPKSIIIPVQIIYFFHFCSACKIKMVNIDSISGQADRWVSHVQDGRKVELWQDGESMSSLKEFFKIALAKPNSGLLILLAWIPEKDFPNFTVKYL